MNRTACYIAGRELSYSRTMIVRKALEKAGFDVIGIFPPDKRFRHYFRLLWQFIRKKRNCDIIIVGFYSQLLMPFIRLLTHKPILCDFYASTYDIMVLDRQKVKPGSFKAWFCWWIDRLALLCADSVILETRNRILNYSQKFRVPQEKFEHVFLAADDTQLAPQAVLQIKDAFLVHFHGEFAPFHGVRTILKAADLVRDENICFEIIGTGITYNKDRAYADCLQLTNVKFINWVPYDRLAENLGRAHCCLGIFGDNTRTTQELTNKVVEILAVARPLITTMNEPVQELVRDGESAILIPSANPHALAKAVLTLRDNQGLARKIAQNGHQQFRKHCALNVFSNRLREIINSMIHV